MSLAAHYRVYYTGHQDSHVTYGCMHCRYEIVGRKHRRAFLFQRFVMHLEGNHLDKLAAGTLACAHCERESPEQDWASGTCPECAAPSLIESRELRRSRILEQELHNVDRL